MNQPIKTFWERHAKSLAFGVSFLVWLLCFKDFFGGKLAFTSDAVSYYDHIKFFIESLGQGVYPLWDPHWNNGVPNEFFLRRFGSFNPFFLLILLFYKMSGAYLASYLAFLAVYYFVGMYGFYKLAQVIFQEDRCAFLAFLLLMFSSLGTRLFDSYILYFFVPGVWFFYFLLAFIRSWKTYAFLGMSFTVMLVLTTYIPFYFINVFLTFVACCLLFYARSLRACIAGTWAFVRQHKALAAVCFLVVTASALPGALIVKEGGSNNFVLPHRHYTSSATNTMQVGIDTIKSWGMLEDLVYSWAYRDLSRFKFAVVYIPIMAWILWLLGLFNPVKKRLVFLLTWGIMLFLMHSPHFPFYEFFYEHVFYFKYFRNLHFYLWIALMPLFILVAVEHFRLFLARNESSARLPVKAVGGVILAHMIALYLLWWQSDAIAVSYLSVILSGVFFVLLIAKRLKDGGIFLFLSALVAIQPLAVYGYLQRNYDETARPYQYDKVSQSFVFRQPFTAEVRLPEDHQERIRYKENRLYYATGWFAFLDRNIYYPVLAKYLEHKCLLYDDVRRVTDQDLDFVAVEWSFFEQENLAYVALFKGEEGFSFADKKPAKPMRRTSISEKSENFKVLQYNANSVIFETDYPEEKFFVYNDAFHKGWQAFRNGEKIKIYRANVAFKGVFLPAGKNRIVFQFKDNRFRRILNFLLIIIFHAVFWSIICFWYKAAKHADHAHNL